MTTKYGDARMPSLRDKIREQAEQAEREAKRKDKEEDKEVEVKSGKAVKGRRLSK